MMNAQPDPFINVTIPVYNEERTLAQSVQVAAAFLEARCPDSWEIVIASNGSTDRTLEIASVLATQLKSVRVLHLSEKGRGRAVKRAWLQSHADILTYMDVDLSTDLAAFPILVEALTSGGFDLAVGSRLCKGSSTTRGLKREFISRSYNLLIKVMFHPGFSDAQCGFKGITRQAAAELLPAVQDNDWFMDTELLIMADKLGYRILDFPVRWIDDPDSRVRICSTAFADIKGLIRLRQNLSRLRRLRSPQTQGVSRMAKPVRS
jgi:glycosyltransferase involved in cell wall biosynthesis